MWLPLQVALHLKAIPARLKFAELGLGICGRLSGDISTEVPYYIYRWIWRTYRPCKLIAFSKIH